MTCFQAHSVLAGSGEFGTFWAGRFWSLAHDGAWGSATGSGSVVLGRKNPRVCIDSSGRHHRPLRWITGNLFETVRDDETQGF